MREIRRESYRVRSNDSNGVKVAIDDVKEIVKGLGTTYRKLLRERALTGREGGAVREKDGQN